MELFAAILQVIEKSFAEPMIWKGRTFGIVAVEAFGGQSHCDATIVTFWVVFAFDDSPGPDRLTIRLLPEIAKTP